MTHHRCVALAVVVLIGGLGLLSRADDKSPATPAEGSPAAQEKPKSGRMFKPWSSLSSLTDAQKDKIREIHARTQEDIKALEKKQHDDIVALLTEDQKQELAKLEAGTKAASKSKPAEPTEPKKD